MIPTEYKSMYDKIIEENSTYKLCNFHVLPNDLIFKASKHKFKLKWTGGTTAEYLKEHDIPNHRINTTRNLSFCDTYFATLDLQLSQITLLRLLLRLLGLRVASFIPFLFKRPSQCIF